MNKHISTILVPVDFSLNTSVAISKAISFLEGNKDANMHLYHVQKTKPDGMAHMLSSFFAGYTRQQVNRDIKRSLERLNDLKKHIESSNGNINVTCSVGSDGSVQESIAKKARQLSAGLIIIGKSSHHPVFSFLNTVIPGKLALAAGIPVLTAKPGSMDQEIKTIVISVGPGYSGKKLDVLDTFRNKYKPSVRLVIFSQNERPEDASRQLLYDIFRAFKKKYPNNLSYEIIQGKNRAKALLDYCDKIGADVLIVQAGAETKAGTWFNRHLSDLVPRTSRTQVLAVMPS